MDLSVMASERKRVRFTAAIDVALPNKEARKAFKDRLTSVRDLLSPPGGPKLDNLGLMTALFDLAEASRPNTAIHSSVVQSGGFMRYSGI